MMRTVISEPGPDAGLVSPMPTPPLAAPPPGPGHLNVLLAAGGDMLAIRSRLHERPLDELGGHPGLPITEIVEQLVRGLEQVQKTPLKSRAYALAITKLEEANHWLREAAGDSQAR